MVGAMHMHAQQTIAYMRGKIVPVRDTVVTRHGGHIDACGAYHVPTVAPSTSHMSSHFWQYTS